MFFNIRYRLYTLFRNTLERVLVLFLEESKGLCMLLSCFLKPLRVWVSRANSKTLAELLEKGEQYDNT